MSDFFRQEKACGFYVSNMHFCTMILPYINKMSKEKMNFYTFFQFNLEENIKKILQGIIGNEEEKEKILKLNWNNFENIKYSSVEKQLKNLKVKQNIILVCGEEKYIDSINELVEKYIKKNNKKFENKNIKVINFYEVSNFNANVKEILDKHDKIINTSGEHDITEIFKDYKKKVV